MLSRHFLRDYYLGEEIQAQSGSGPQGGSKEEERDTFVLVKEKKNSGQYLT